MKRRVEQLRNLEFSAHPCRRIASRMHFLYVFPLILDLDVAIASCLANATRDRKNLGEGAESNPVGIWRSGDYAAAHLTSMAAKILIEERHLTSKSCERMGRIVAEKVG